jgi:hypothetical protein
MPKSGKTPLRWYGGKQNLAKSVNGQAKRDQGGQVKGTHLVENKRSLFLLSGHALLEPVALSVHG